MPSSSPVSSVASVRSAIVRGIPTNFGRALVRAGAAERVDRERAVVQHRDYARALKDAGLEVDLLAADERFPDAPLVGDLAIGLGRGHVILGRPVALPRADDLALLRPHLEREATVHEAPEGCLLDGADVVVAGALILAARSPRTDAAGLDFLAGLGRSVGFEVQVLEVRGHHPLQAVCSVLPDGALLHVAGLLPRDLLGSLAAPAAPEIAGASVLVLADRVIVPAEALRTADLLAARGLAVVPLALSEFSKLRAGPARLSVRY